MEQTKNKAVRRFLWMSIPVVVMVAIIVAVLLMTGDGQDVTDFATPYCTLEYPDEWGDSLVVSDRRDGAVYEKTFSAQLGDNTYPLFTLYFGETDKGNLYGHFADEAGTPVYILCYTPPEGHTLTAAQEEQFYAMADGINTVVRSLAANEAFSVN